MDTNEYNGWTNWATWNVPLWIDNDESTYHERLSFMRRTFSIDASSVKGFVLDMFPNGTPDMDERDLADINWQEIADAWIAEIEEDA